MSIERRTLVMALPAVMALAAPGIAQDAGQDAGRTTPPTSAEPVRGLEPLQSSGTPSATPIPVPDTPRLVLPKTAPATRAQTPSRQRQAPSNPQRATTGTSGSDRDAASSPRVGQAAGTARAGAPASSRPADTAPQQPSPSAPAASSEPVGGTPTSAPPPATPVEQAPATVPAPTASPAPSAAGAADSVTAPQTGRAMPFWLWLAVILVVVGVVWMLRRGGRNVAADTRHVVDSAEPVETVPAAAPAPALPEEAAPAVSQDERAAIRETLPPPAARTAAATLPAAATTPAEAGAPRFLDRRSPDPLRARLAVELRPLRAGLNLLSATAECEIVVTNIGTAAADGIRVQAVLLTAHAAQDADLASVNAGPVVRPATTPFALAPGETRVVRTVSATAREAIHSMTAANRPMFVPIVAVNILYASGEITGQTARAWAIGIERVDSAKLAPFWLDAPARMYDGIAARPHAVAIER